MDRPLAALVKMPAIHVRQTSWENGELKRMATGFLASLLATGFALSATAATPSVVQVEALPAGYSQAPLSVGGRVAPPAADQDGGFGHQWPGVYFEATFRGDSVAFRTGPGEVILHVQVDGKPLQTLVKPLGTYRISGLDEGEHRVRVDVATESQAGANHFGGFLLPTGATPLPAKARMRRLEFIGDSHTVGYGNISATRECTEAEVLASTDTTRAYGPRVAGHYGADYRVNAISGRGIVRNFGGGAGDTLPQAYPFVLFDHSVRDTDTAWQPQVVVMALGTNDFSTPLKAGEPWKTRKALQEDYVQAYVAFVQLLRMRYPEARFVLWATDGAEGEIRTQVIKVVKQLQQSGETRVGFVPVGGLGMEGCHWHPSLADHEKIAEQLTRHIDNLPALP